MGLWNGNVENSFDKLFDLDRNGKLDIGEQVLQFMVISQEMETGNNQEQEGDNYELER